MEIEVRFFGAVSNAAGGRESARLNLEGGTLAELLDHIISKWPGTEDYIRGGRSGSIVFVLNESALEDPDPGMVLKDGDKFSIMPFVAGG